MCYFITVGIQQNRSAALTEGVPRGLLVQPAANRFIIRRLPNGVSTFVVTDGMCSCGLFHEESQKPDEGATLEKLRRKYQSKGWSQTKIERAIAQHRADSKSQDQPCGLAPEVRSFLADTCDEVGELYLIMHMYQGDIEEERIELFEGPVVSCDELRAANPVTKTDQVYRIVSKKRRG